MAGINFDLDAIPRNVLLPPEETYAMVNLMELGHLPRGTSPWSQLATFCATVFVSTLPGSYPALRDLLTIGRTTAEDVVYLLVAGMAFFVGIVMAIVWYGAARARKKLIKRLLDRKITRAGVKTALDYR